MGPSPQVRPLNEQGTALEVEAAGGARYVLRAAKEEAFAGQTAERLELLRWLAGQGIPAAAPVPLDGGRQGFLAGEDGRRYWLAPWLPSGPAAETPDWYARAAAAVARLHRALAAYPGEIRSGRMDLARGTLKADAPLLRAFLAAAGWADFAHVRAGFERAAAYLAQRLPGRLPGLPAQRIHGDCRSSNILWEGGRVTGILGLDHLPWGPRVFDLGCFLASLAGSRFHAPDENEAWFNGLRPFLLGYQAEMPLSEAEITILPAVMMAAQVRFAAGAARCGSAEQARSHLEALFWLDAHSGQILHEMA